jgi:hypothetical protein
MPTLHAQRLGSKQNAKTWANQFKARLLEPGIISYEDCNQGVSLVSKETIDKCVKTFIGRPLILARNKYDEPTYRHAPIAPETMEQLADGYISDVVYDDVDGWWYAVGTVHNDDAKEAIRKVGLVSCAYDVLSIGPGGSYHNIPYSDEITSFEGEHLAIVAQPRYEKATIRLNAKLAINKPIKHMFKWVKTITNALTPKPETAEQGELPEGSALQIGEQQVPVAELVATHQRVNGKDGEPLDGASEIALADGKRVSIDKLIASHQKLNAMEDEELKKKNEKEEEEKKAKENAAAEEDEKKKKENAEKEEKEESEKKKENSKARIYRVNTAAGPLSVARENGIEIETTGGAPETRESRVARANARYGPKNVTPAK